MSSTNKINNNMDTENTIRNTDSAKTPNDQPELQSDENINDLVLTGFFKDGIRRIDVVLVVQDDGDLRAESIKINFLMSVIKYGLELELEAGRMAIHRNLIFIKIHAPDQILEEYGTYYDVKRYFKDSHVEFVKSSKKKYMFNFMQIEHEREWIKLVRENNGPTNYSTIERSTIVYKILLFVRYGVDDYSFGLSRLMKKKIILDAYALHDGPYFFLSGQNMSKVNARQILYYNWIDFKNFFKVQPLNLIHEYFGDRIGFYFAFYGFYNESLIYASIAGICSVTAELLDKTDAIINDEACNDHKTIICPICRHFDACPFRKLSDYCFTFKLINSIDNAFAIYFCLFTAVWALLFMGIWKRKENYLIWMWELNKNRLKYATRSEYKINSKNITRSELTGTIKNFENFKKNFVLFAITTTILLFCPGQLVFYNHAKFQVENFSGYRNIPLTDRQRGDTIRIPYLHFWYTVMVITVLIVNALLIYAKYLSMVIFSDHINHHWGEYMIITLFTIFDVTLYTILENVCVLLAFQLNDFENHKTNHTYERSLIIKLFGITYAFTFSILFFYGFIKGAFYTYPSDPKRWYTPAGIAMLTCSPLGCIDEIWMVLMVSLFIKQICMKAIFYIFHIRTDYNQGDVINSTIPCWEREYRLLSITERDIFERFRNLVTQFGLVTLFVSVFPLAPLFALIINIWDIRYNAKLFLLGTRRPLLTKCSGLGAWRDLLVLLVYATALTNGLTIAVTTKTIDRYIYLKKHGTLHGYINWTLSIFDVNDYLNETGHGSPAEAFNKYNGFKPEKYCLYSGRRTSPFSDNRYVLIKDHWYLKYYGLLFIIIFEHIVITLILIMYYVIPPLPRDIQDTLAMERRLRNMYVHNLKPS